MLDRCLDCLRHVQVDHQGHETVVARVQRHAQLLQLLRGQDVFVVVDTHLDLSPSQAEQCADHPSDCIDARRAGLHEGARQREEAATAGARRRDLAGTKLTVKGPIH
jgi:hypothetical protein